MANPEGINQYSGTAGGQRKAGLQVKKADKRLTKALDKSIKQTSGSSTRIRDQIRSARTNSFRAGNVLHASRKK